MESEYIESESESESESEISETEIENDRLVKNFLNDTRVEDALAESRSLEPTYTPKQLEKINTYEEAVALILEADEVYKEGEDIHYGVLEETRSKLNEIAEVIKQLAKNANVGYNYLRCGKPYFKDKENFTPPDNADTILMRQSQMYDFSQVGPVPSWTVKDKTDFINAILEMSRDIKRKELRDEMSRLNKDTNGKKINELQKEIKQLREKTLNELALPLEQEYDWVVLANSLSRRHTEQEYQALWKLFLHPSINKSSWSKAEHIELLKIAEANNNQDWDHIAKQLNTGRTGYQCFVYHRTNMANNAPSVKWSTEEIEYLQRAVDFYREGEHIPWGKIAATMDKRTKIQAYNKYMRMITSRKGRFLDEEDIVIWNSYEKYGTDFKKISQFIPGRTAVQLKRRFQILTKRRQSATWSMEDDMKLLQIMANLETFSYSSVTQHFPGKDRENIRSRYITLTKWMKTHPGSNLSVAPRRGARRLLHGQGPANISDAIANLNKRFVKEVKIKSKNEITRHSRFEDIKEYVMVELTHESELRSNKPDLSELDNENTVCFLPDAYTQNINNLKSLLMFLNAALVKGTFLSSIYYSKSPGLCNSSPLEYLHRVKSYSKKSKVRIIEMKDFPDIWGEKPELKLTRYVLPPNYSTITGCLGLLKYFSGNPEGKPEDGINLSLMQRKNMYLKLQMDMCKVRFAKLHMWPMLLSNQIPHIRRVTY